MELTKTNTSRRVIDTFSGQMYFPDKDDYEKLATSLSKPEDYHFWEFPKINLIEDNATNIRFLIGDFNGNDDWYGFSIKIFIYKDGKALGHVKYLVESKWKDDKIEAHFIDRKEDGFVVFGWWFTGGDQKQKDPFLFFVERPAAKKFNTKPLALSYPKGNDSTDSTVKQAKEPKKAVVKTSVVSKTSNKPKTIKATKISEEEIREEQLSNSFVELTALKEKQACLHFLAYILIKIGFQVQQGNIAMDFSDLILLKDNEYSFVHALSSNKKEGVWKIDVPKEHYEHNYIFCHTISKEFFPDIFIATGKEVAKWMKKNGKISTKDKVLVSIKNLWDPLS